MTPGAAWKALRPKRVYRFDLVKADVHVLFLGAGPTCDNGKTAWGWLEPPSCLVALLPRKSYSMDTWPPAVSQALTSGSTSSPVARVSQNLRRRSTAETAHREMLPSNKD